MIFSVKSAKYFPGCESLYSRLYQKWSGPAANASYEHYTKQIDPNVKELLPYLEKGPQVVAAAVDAVFKAGNATRDTIPTHLVIGQDISADVARFYSHVCPAGVYEEVEGVLLVNAPNCVDCKATDVLGPRWTPREGGSGPKYKRM